MMNINEIKKRLLYMVMIPVIFLASGCEEAPEYEYLPESCRSYDLFVQTASEDIFQFLSDEYGGVNRNNYHTRLGEVLKLEIEDNDPTDSIDLEGIQCFQSINEVDLKGSAVRDIGPLASLQNVQVVSIENTRISTIESLRGYSKVNSLTLAGNRSLSNVDGISEMKKLTSLSLPDNNITELESFTGLDNLTTLSLPGNGIIDLSDITNTSLPSLISLDVSYNPIDTSTLSFLDLLALEEFKGVNTGLDNAKAANLNSLTGIKVIDISSDQVSAAADPSENVNNITDLSFLTPMANLETVSLRDSGLVDLSAFGLIATPLANIQTIDVSDNVGLTNINGITTHTNLSNFIATNCSINDFSPLLDMNNITALDLRMNSVTTIPDFLNGTKMTALTTLDLRHNLVSNLGNLENHPAIRSINLDDEHMLVDIDGNDLADKHASNLTNPISTVSGLKNIANLQTLTFGENVAVSTFNNSFDNLPSYTPQADSDNTTIFGLKLSGDITIVDSFNNIPTVTTIDFSGRSITSISDDSFQLANLTSIDLSDNKLTGNLNYLDNMPAITSIDLSGSTNNVSNIDVFAAANNANFSNLLSVDLSGNNIAGNITGLFTNLSLIETIDLSSSGIIGSISNSFDTLPRLESLDLSSNSITNIGTSFTALSGLSRDIEINLLGSGFSGINDSFNSISSTYTNNTIRIDSSSVGVISNSFNSLRSIEHLNLAGLGITSINSSFHSYIGGDSTILNVHLENNNISTIDAASFVGTRMDLLNISNSGSLNDVTFLDTVTKVVSLNLSGTNVTDGTSFDTLANLETLQLSNIPGFNNVSLSNMDLETNNPLLSSIYLNNSGITTITNRFNNLSSLVLVELNGVNVTSITNSFNSSNLADIVENSFNLSTVVDSFNGGGLSQLGVMSNNVTIRSSSALSVTNSFKNIISTTAEIQGSTSVDILSNSFDLASNLDDIIFSNRGIVNELHGFNNAPLSAFSFTGFNSISDIHGFNNSQIAVINLSVDVNASDPLIDKLEFIENMAAGALTDLTLNGNHVAFDKTVISNLLAGKTGLSILEIYNNPTIDDFNINIPNSLTRLVVTNGSVTNNVSHLNGLSNLSYIDLTGNALTNLNDIPNLASLNTMIVDTGGIAQVDNSFNNVGTLVFNGGSITNFITSLGVVNIEDSFNDSQFDNVALGGSVTIINTATGSFNRATTLDLTNYAFNDVNFVEKISTLQNLTLGGAVTDLTTITFNNSNFSDLAVVDLSATGVSIFTNQFSGMSSLTRVNLSSLNLGNISGSFNSTNLVSTQAAGTNIVLNFIAAANISNSFKTINASDLNINNLSALITISSNSFDDSTSLVNFNITKNQVASINGFNNAPLNNFNFTGFSRAGTTLSGFTGSNISTVSFDISDIANISVIANLDKNYLNSVTLTGGYTNSDIQNALSAHNGIASLTIDSNNLSNLSYLNNKATITTLDLSGSGILTLSGLNNLSSLNNVTLPAGTDITGSFNNVGIGFTLNSNSNASVLNGLGAITITNSFGDSEFSNITIPAAVTITGGSFGNTRTLDASAYALSDMAFLNDMDALEDLTLGGNANNTTLAGVSFVTSNFASLNSVDIRGANITSFTNQFNLSNLTQILLNTAGYTSITNSFNSPLLLDTSMDGGNQIKFTITGTNSTISNSFKNISAPIAQITHGSGFKIIGGSFDGATSLNNIILSKTNVAELDGFDNAPLSSFDLTGFTNLTTVSGFNNSRISSVDLDHSNVANISFISNLDSNNLNTVTLNGAYTNSELSNALSPHSGLTSVTISNSDITTTGMLSGNNGLVSITLNVGNGSLVTIDGLSNISGNLNLQISPSLITSITNSFNTIGDSSTIAGATGSTVLNPFVNLTTITNSFNDNSYSTISAGTRLQNVTSLTGSFTNTTTLTIDEGTTSTGVRNIPNVNALTVTGAGAGYNIDWMEGSFLNGLSSLNIAGAIDYTSVAASIHGASFGGALSLNIDATATFNTEIDKLYYNDNLTAIKADLNTLYNNGDNGDGFTDIADAGDRNIQVNDDAANFEIPTVHVSISDRDWSGVIDTARTNQVVAI